MKLWKFKLELRKIRCLIKGHTAEQEMLAGHIWATKREDLITIGLCRDCLKWYW